MCVKPHGGGAVPIENAATGPLECRAVRFPGASAADLDESGGDRI